MSEETTKDILAEAIDLVAEAQKPGKFNLADAIKNRSFPEKSVVVYTDILSARKLYDLQEDLETAAFKGDVEEYSKLEEEAKTIAESVKSSKLVFHLKGLAQDVVDRIGDAIDTNDKTDISWSKDYICALLAESITSVENASGDIDDHKFTLEDTKGMYVNLPQESWSLLIEAVEQLTLATGIFKGITDAGFLQKS
jgi:hypothetical protein